MNLIEASRLARSLMDEYGLQHYSFVWDRAKGRNGQTNYVRRTISLSAPVTRLRDPEWVENTIRHEIAHALVGPGHGHGSVWQRKAREIGCTAERSSGDRVDTSVIAKYRLECAATGEVLGHVNRKGKRIATAQCRCHSLAARWITQN